MEDSDSRERLRGIREMRERASEFDAILAKRTKRAREYRKELYSALRIANGRVGGKEHFLKTEARIKAGSKLSLMEFVSTLIERNGDGTER